MPLRVRLSLLDEHRNLHAYTLLSWMLTLSHRTGCHPGPVLLYIRKFWFPPGSRRQILTLAIETSCDDTSVAILEKHGKAEKIWKESESNVAHARADRMNDHAAMNRNNSQAPHVVNHALGQSAASLHFHEKVTADNSKFRGVHPMVALDSHQINLGRLVQKALQNLPGSDNHGNEFADPQKSISIYDQSKESHVQKQKPDFITVTRGPGMRSSLSTGLDTAQGLAIAWRIPLVGVNHMQAHALTSRLVSALENPETSIEPAFPFLSLLVSGGHTMLVHSASLTSHHILATTADIAIGDCLDKCGRHILPSHLLASSKNTMYGRLLEAFAFPSDAPYEYTPPPRRAEELARKPTKWGWAFGVPLAETRSGSKSKSMQFSFTGTGSTVQRTIENRAQQGGMGEAERQALAREAMRVVFEHLASRVVMALQFLQNNSEQALSTLVVSGGVACNGFLRHILRAFLDVRGFSHIKLAFPPLALCTDNAAMIAWTGMEMFEAGWESELGVQAVRKWSVDPDAEDGGILGLDGWRRRGS